MSYKNELDAMTWSFSRVHLWESCPYAFYKKYIEGASGDNNFYAENGKAMHLVFEKLLKEEIDLDEAPTFYIEEYECIYSTVKQSTMDSTFTKCIDYLCSMDILNDKYEIVDVEQKLEFKIGKYNFVGYLDLLLSESEELILVDHKSLDHFFKKDGTVLKAQEDGFNSYKHQMYLYAKGIYERYGKFPKKIVWHHFKDSGKLTVIDFSKDDYEESLSWAKNTIQKIYRDKTFKEMKSFMQCYSLCDYRNLCEYKGEDGD